MLVIERRTLMRSMMILLNKKLNVAGVSLGGRTPDLETTLKRPIFHQIDISISLKFQNSVDFQILYARRAGRELWEDQYCLTEEWTTDNDPTSDTESETLREKRRQKKKESPTQANPFFCKISDNFCVTNWKHTRKEMTPQKIGVAGQRFHSCLLATPPTTWFGTRRDFHMHTEQPAPTEGDDWQLL